jgi:hypothetical protein
MSDAPNDQEQTDLAAELANIEAQDLAKSERIAARDRVAVRLKLSGATYADIADHLGFKATSSAYEAVQRELRRTRQEPADELRQIELLRLDRVQMSLWAVLTQSNVDFDTLQRATLRFIQLSKRRAELLGLDAPKRVDITQQIRTMAIREGLDPEQAVNDAQELLQAYNDSV